MTTTNTIIIIIILEFTVIITIIIIFIISTSVITTIVITTTMGIIITIVIISIIIIIMIISTVVLEGRWSWISVVGTLGGFPPSVILEGRWSKTAGLRRQYGVVHRAIVCQGRPRSTDVWFPKEQGGKAGYGMGELQGMSRLIPP